MFACTAVVAVTFPVLFFFLRYTATTEIYTLSLHDALPISAEHSWGRSRLALVTGHSRGSRSPAREIPQLRGLDRKSTRLNSSHITISYAVFCLKKKTRIRYCSSSPVSRSDSSP